MRRTPARAFTLIELLVVIAIIALLISIMLPALASARGSARTLGCLAQMRSLGQMSLLYLNDHDDTFMRSQHSAMPKQVMPWEYAMFAYFEDEQFVTEDDRWFSLVDTDYRCPQDPRRDLEYTKRYGYNGSYGVNVYMELDAFETGGPTWTRSHHIPRPSSTIWFAEVYEGDNLQSRSDHIMAHFWTQSGAPPDADVAGDRHGNGSGYIHVDGHADKRPLADTFDRSQSTDDWNPDTAG